MPELSRGGDCAQARKELGVYVLGAIGPGERAQVDQHLASCPWCREELAGLAGMPGLLRRVPADVALPAWTDDTSGGAGPVPGPPLDTLIRRVKVIRLRWRLTAAAAALVVGLAAATGGQVLHARPASTPAAAAAAAPAAGAATAPRWTGTTTGASVATGARAAVRYSAQPWGTELEVRVTGIPAGTRCQLLVTNAQGQDLAAGGWIVTTGRRPAWHPASVPWPATSLSGFDVTAGGQTLVAVPGPASGHDRR